MMKFMVAIAMVVSSSFAMAEGGGENYGAEEVIAAGGLTTVVGGGCVATVVQSGENSDIIYTGTCNTAPTAALTNDHTTIFATAAEASAACQRLSSGYVQAVYKMKNWKLQVVGFQCAPLNDFNGGN